MHVDGRALAAVAMVAADGSGVGANAARQFHEDGYAAPNVCMSNYLPGFIDRLAKNDDCERGCRRGRYGTAREV